MTQRYILVCSSCENRIPVEISQAGRTINCVRCGRSIKLGTLRDIRALESASIPASEEIKRPAVSWSPARRAAFAVGFVFLVICGIFGSYSLWKSAQIKTDRPVTRANDAFLQRVAAFSPTTMLSNWEKIDVSTVEVWVEHQYLRDRREAAILQIWGWVGMICAGLGAAAIALSFMTGNRRRTKVR